MASVTPSQAGIGEGPLTEVYSRLFRILLAAGAVSALAGAAWASIRIYQAERLGEKGSLEDIQQAVGLAPGDSGAWSRLGVLLEQRGDSAGAAKALERAVALNRYNASAWVDLGLHFEFENNPGRAEQCLLEAVRVNGSFSTRWALANFHLRQGGGDRFWTTLREAVSRSRDDLTPAFELCHRASLDPQEILDRAIPDEARVNRAYWWYLYGNGHRTALAGVWQRLEGRLEAPDLDIGLRYADELLRQGRVDPARQVWNRLCQTRLLPYAPLEPSRGRSLTNGKFELTPSALGFDWRPATVEGVNTDLGTSRGQAGLAVRFSGAHPESADLLWQWAPVEPARAYRLTFRYATEDLPADTGLRWTLFDGDTVLASGSPLAATGEWRPSEVAFHTSARTRLVRVVFSYRRSPGTTRAQGLVVLGEVDLAPAGARVAGGRPWPAPASAPAAGLVCVGFSYRRSASATIGRL